TRVARGRSGQVFRARAVDGSAVAIKVHERAEDGRLEAMRLASVAHPGIAALLDHGRTGDGRMWLALPWIEGATLAHRLASGPPLPLDRARTLVADLAAAVDALHDVGLVHGDLSPDNVLLDGDGRPVLIDLAASMSVDAAAIDRTTGLEVATTPRYAAPEVAGGQPVGPSADVYAVALIAYEAVTGAFPFPDVATPIAMLGHHAATEPVAPSEHRPSLPPAVDAALLWALAKDPADRPATAGALAAALADDRVPDRRLEPVSTERVEGRTGDRGDRPTRTRPRPVIVWLAALAVVGLAVWAAVVAGVITGDGQTDDATVSSAAVAVPSTSGVDAATAPADDGPPATAPDPTWPAGRATGLSCNLLEVADFEAAELPGDFYRGDPTNTAARAGASGVDGTAALRVGADDAFGLYGEIVPIGTHRTFVFTAWIRHEPMTRTALYVDYLDEDFVQLTAERDRLDVDERHADADAAAGGTRVTLESTAPDDAVYAVPTFFKDGSPGALLVDEVVFGPTSTCSDLAG
ncbi:MAG: serine/threonine-protein kinase, partial [Actinomycetota bacterium]